ncbi:MAG: MFS transporter [Actinomycetota bacterium]|nr:MFS transporter [Actinomycetota bacterium]
MDRTAPGARSLPALLRERARCAAAALRDRQLARLMLTWGAWITAEWAFLIVVSVLAFDRGGAAAVGLTGAVRLLPAAFLGPLTAMVTDRLPRPRVLAAVHLSWVLVALATAGLAAVDAPLAAVLVVVAVGSVALSIFKPCANAMIPQLVNTPSQLIVATSAYSTVEAAGTVLGPVLSGVLLVTLDPAAAFVVLAVLFALGALTAGRIQSPFQPSRRSASSARSLLLEPLLGFRVLIGEGGIRVVVGLFLLQATMRGLLNVFLVVLALSSFDSGEAQTGSLFAAVGLGGLLGAVAALGGGGVHRSALLFGLGIALWGIPVAGIGGWPNPIVAWLGLAVVGLGNAIADIYGFSLLNRLIPDHISGRAWGAFYSAGQGMIALGSLAAPILIALVGLSWAMGVTGVLLALSPLLLWRRLRSVDAAAAARPEVVELLRQVPTFAPLTGIGLEHLAKSTHELTLLDAEPVVRQDDAGELFYVVVQGQVSVSQAGLERRRLGPGDSFGEIALLKSVPRTATVTSVGPSRLLSIDGDSFVAAVTGHRVAEQLAQDAAADLLRGDQRPLPP